MIGRAAALGIALLVVPALGVGMAHASALGVDPDPLTARTVGACSTAPLGVEEAPSGLLNAILGYTAVRLTIPAPCAGSDLAVTIHGGGAVQATAAAPAVAAGPLTLTSSATYGGLFRPAYAVAVTFDGWSVPASF